MKGTIAAFTRQDQAKNAQMTVPRSLTAETGTKFRKKLHTGIRLAASRKQQTDREFPREDSRAHNNSRLGNSTDGKQGQAGEEEAVACQVQNKGLFALHTVSISSPTGALSVPSWSLKTLAPVTIWSCTDLPRDCSCQAKPLLPQSD